MTSFSAVTRDLPCGTLTLEIKTVNHRFLEIQFRGPDTLRVFEPAMREQISAQVKRGKVDCRLDLRKRDTGLQYALLDTSSLEQLKAVSAIVQEVFSDATPLSVAEVLQWPGVLRRDESTENSLEQDCAELTTEVLQQLMHTRAREGAQLKVFVQQRVAEMKQLLLPLSAKIPSLVAGFKDKLALRMREALGGHEEERVLQEVTLFASKIDIEEELSRLQLHLDEVDRVLEAGGTVGKRLDFLMQELHREANTLGSKSVSSELSRASMDLKVLIEQMREQVQNIE